MLEHNENTLVPESLYLMPAHLTCEKSILRVVLEVAPAVGCAVHVCAGAVKARDIRCDTVVSDDLSDLVHNFRVKRRRHYVLRRECSRLKLALLIRHAGGKQGGRQPLRPVLVTRSGCLDGLDGHRPMEGISYKRNHLIKRHLIQQLIPAGVLKIRTDHVHEL